MSGSACLVDMMWGTLVKTIPRLLWLLTCENVKALHFISCRALQSSVSYGRSVMVMSSSVATSLPTERYMPGMWFSHRNCCQVSAGGGFCCSECLPLCSPCGILCSLASSSEPSFRGQPRFTSGAEVDTSESIAVIADIQEHVRWSDWVLTLPSLLCIFNCTVFFSVTVAERLYQLPLLALHIHFNVSVLCYSCN